MTTRFDVPGSASGERLDVFLCARTGQSRAAVQKLIEGGLVTVDGVTQPKRHCLSGGERVELQAGEPPRQVQAEPAATFVVVYEDEDVLAVDKPAGVVVHPGNGRASGTLVQALEDQVAGGEDPVRPGVVHRLDRDTSGLLMLARHEQAYASLRQQISERSVLREYLALVVGRPPARAGTIDAPLGRYRRVRTRMSSDTDDPHEAITHFQVEQAMAKTTLLRVRLETGRTHQIRAHLQAIGYPVAGDPEYGRPGLYGLERQFLHAQRLRFAHPISGQELDLTSGLPADLASALVAAQAES